MRGKGGIIGLCEVGGGNDRPVMGYRALAEDVIIGLWGFVGIGLNPGY